MYLKDQTKGDYSQRVSFSIKQNGRKSPENLRYREVRPSDE